ncbi:MAG TPA: GDSL-type esterase/lipase family protein [Ignavibacteriaceae bacterium]|nr:GDSL-type esterase/lipase family protein [Ignavibacteriaceae bacterium]
MKIITIYFKIIILLTFSFQLFGQDNIPSFKKNPLYIQEVELYEVYETKKANIVMLGDSHIQGANWGELLGRNDVVNRGVTSDVLEGYVARLPYVTKLNPKVCFIMGGLNDVYMWIPIDKIIIQYSILINELKKNKIKVVIHSALYPAEGADNPSDRNKIVSELNILLRELAEKENIIFIDLNEKMSRNMFTKKELTNSWYHLNAKGYEIWRDEVQRVLKLLKL